MSQSPFEPAPEGPNHQSPIPNPPRALLAHRLYPPGRLRAKVHVPARHVAIVLAEAGATTLGPGDHSLPNWPLPAPEVILLDAGPLPAELQWDGLPAGDGELVTLTAGLDVIVADPLRLHAAWLRLGPGPEWRLPEDAVAGRLRERAAQLVGSYAAADLGRQGVQERLAGELAAPLAAELARVRPGARLTRVDRPLPDPGRAGNRVRGSPCGAASWPATRL